MKIVFGFILWIFLALALTFGPSAHGSNSVFVGAQENEACKALQNARLKMDVVSSNIANLITTRTPEGGPYRRKELVCADFVCDINESSETIAKYEPDHPDAAEDGYVLYPDIDLNYELDSMIQATRDFEAAVKSCPRD